MDTFIQNTVHGVKVRVDLYFIVKKTQFSFPCCEKSGTVTLNIYIKNKTDSQRWKLAE